MRRTVLFALALAALSTGCLKPHNMAIAPVPVVAVKADVPDSIIAKAIAADSVPDSRGPRG